MTEHERDPETDALERQLNSAFASARPRPEFEDELWQRIRDRGGLRLRLREAWAGLSGTPLVASGAGLAALVLVALIAIVSLRAGGGGHSSMGGAAPSRSSASLPAPALKAGEGQASAVDAQVPAAIPYYGPANLSWSGSLPTLPTTAPVLSFQPPAPDAISAFTTQAALGDPYVLSVDLTGPEPRYSIHNGSQAASGPAPSEQDAKRAADAFLADHHLQPGWPADVVVTRTPKGTVSVSYFASSGSPEPVPGSRSTRRGTARGSAWWSVPARRCSRSWDHCR